MLYNNLFDVINYRGYVENVSLHASFDKKRLFLFVIAILTLFWGGGYSVQKIYNVFLGGIAILVLTMNIAGSARIYDYLTVFYIPLLVLKNQSNNNKTIYKVSLGAILVVNYIISFRIWEVI